MQRKSKRVSGARWIRCVFESKSFCDDPDCTEVTFSGVVKRRKVAAKEDLDENPRTTHINCRDCIKFCPLQLCCTPNTHGHCSKASAFGRFARGNLLSRESSKQPDFPDGAIFPCRTLHR